MSTELLEDANLDLLLASLTQALWHALAFRRAASVRALGAPRAHVLHARAPSRRVALPPSPRPFWPLASRSQHARPLPRRRAAPGALQHRRQVGHGGWRPATVGSCHGRRRPSRSSAPAAPCTVRAYPQARPLVLVAATSP